MVPLTAPQMSTALAPSEIVMLRGASFASPGHLGFGERVLGGSTKVSASDWMRAAWLAATAAAAAAGDVRLTPSSTKHLFGLLTSSTVQIARGDGAGHWPADSLEARLVAHVARGTDDLRDVYVALIGQKVANPEMLGLAIARAGLMSRGLIETHATRVLKVLPSSEIVVPPATAALVDDAAVAGTQTLVQHGGGLDAAVWAAVGTALKRALAICTLETSSNT